jgi:Tfp pilus assembly protein PilV
MLTAPSTPIGQPRRRRNDSAFTIVEVVVATFVMALGITTSIITLQSGYKAIDTARGNTLASQILQSEIERIRLMNWATVSDATTMMGEKQVDLSAVFSSNAELANKFTLKRTVTNDASRVGEVVNIALQVTWKTSEGRNHQRSFQTKYVKNGLYDYYYTLAGP